MSHHQSSRAGGWHGDRDRNRGGQFDSRGRGGGRNNWGGRGGTNREFCGQNRNEHGSYGRNVENRGGNYFRDSSLVMSYKRYNHDRSHGPDTKKFKGKEDSDFEYGSVPAGIGGGHSDIVLSKEHEDFKNILKSQYRFPEDVDKLPSDAFFPDSELWVRKKKEAAAKAIEAVKEKLDKMKKDAELKVQVANYDNYDGYSSEESYIGGAPVGANKNDINQNLADVEKFMTAIESCYPLTLGFDIVPYYKEADKCCFCPCGGGLKKWRESVGVDSLIGDRDCDLKKANTPMSLMGHLRDIGGVKKEKKGFTPMGCEFHYAIRVYLETLYSMNGDYRGGVGHKALYQMNDDNYRRAVAAELTLLKKEIQAGKKVIAEQETENWRLKSEREKLEEDMAKIKKINEHFYDKISSLEKDREKLKIEKKNPTSCLTDEQLQRSSKSWQRYRDVTKKCYTKFSKQGKDTKDVTPKLKLTVEMCMTKTRVFDVQKFLDEEYCRSKNTNIWKAFFASQLKNPEHILLDWNVVFENKVTEGQDAKDTTAVDDGGPSRQFLSECWKQLLALHILVGKKPVKLFEKSRSGVIPVTDDFLCHKVKISLSKQSGCDDSSEIDQFIENAKCYYRAVGRIILHSIMVSTTVSSSALVPLFQNFLLRNCSPRDPEYDKDDILQHITGIVFGDNPKKALSDLLKSTHETEDEEGNREEIILDENNIFSVFVYDACIDSRKIALSAMLDGLAPRDEKGEVIIDLRDIFWMMPHDAMERILFSRQSLTAEEVIGCLVPQFDQGGSEADADSVDRLECVQRQKDFYSNIFVPFLRTKGESDPSFLSKFVECCTGLNYLPYDDENQSHTISVEFNYEESLPGYLPMFHTCVNLIKLPGYLYGSPEEFAVIMEKSIDLSVGTFGIQ